MKLLLMMALTVAASSSFAFEIQDFKVFGCQNFHHRVVFNFEDGIAKNFYGFKEVASRIQNVRINESESKIQFEQVDSDGSVTALSLENIIPGHKVEVIYADLYLAGKKVNGCAASLD